MGTPERLTPGNPDAGCSTWGASPLRGFPRQSVGRLCRLEGTAVPPLESGVSRLRYSEGEAKRYPKGVADWRPRHQNIAALSGVRGFLLLKAKRYGLEINVAWRKM